MASGVRTSIRTGHRIATAAKQQARHQSYRYNRFRQSGNLLQRWAAQPTFYYQVGGLGTVAGGVYIANLETVPVSGRRRFNVIGPDTEAMLAKEQYKAIMQEYRGRFLSDYDPRVRLVRRVLDRLIPASGLTDERWEVHVIDSPEKNAFVIPGGKVFVFTGILPICKDENGIATVLGHEIAHNVAHHAAERMSSGFIISTVMLALLVVFGLPDVGTRMLLDLGFSRPGSRRQEAEADYIGLMMMAQSCYNPDEAPKLWQRMQSTGEREPPQMLSTHPSSHNREQKLTEWLPEAKDKFASSDCASTLSYADDFRKAFTQIRW